MECTGGDSAVIVGSSILRMEVSVVVRYRDPP